VSSFLITDVYIVACRESLGTSGFKEGAAGAVEGNHRENRVIGKEGEADHRRHKHSPQKTKKWRQTRRLFGKNSLKEKIMWYIDHLLGNDHETNN
jgi:hypothetical protein